MIIRLMLTARRGQALFRQQNRKRCPLRRLALHCNGTVMGLNQLVDNRHSESRALRGRVRRPEMIIASNDGEVSIKAAEEGRLLRVETESGDIAVSYKTPPASLKLTANSGSSDIRARLDGFKETRRTEQSVEGTIGDASNTLKLVSQDGTISVK